MKHLMLTNVPNRLRRMFAHRDTAKLLNYGTGSSANHAKGTAAIAS